MAVNRVEVIINSRRYALKAEESEEYLKKLAEHIEEKIGLVLKNGQNILGERPLVLAALNICDEYYKCEEAGRILQKQLANCSDKLVRANAEIKSLKEATPQVSFDEQEAEEKLKKTEDELRRAQERIRSLEARLNDAERRRQDGSKRNGYNGNGKRN